MNINKTSAKHRPTEILTEKDANQIGQALFNADISIECVLPLHTGPNNPDHLDGGWEYLVDELITLGLEGMSAIFGKYGTLVASALDDEDIRSSFDVPPEILRDVFWRIGGWVIMGSYPTVSQITLNEQGRFSSCSVHYGIQRTFVVWGKTYKQAIVKAINEQRRYFNNEVKKAREEYGNL